MDSFLTYNVESASRDVFALSVNGLAGVSTLVITVERFEMNRTAFRVHYYASVRRHGVVILALFEISF